jgi:hypothetical protein
LTRYDAVLIIVPTVVLVILTLHKPEQKRVVPAFLIPLCLLGIHAWVHMKVIAPCYRPLPGLVFPLLHFSLLTVVLLLVTTMTRPGRLLLQRISNRLPVLKACFICGFTSFLFFAWYIRPHLVVDGRILSLVTHTLSGIGKPEWLNLIGGENALNIHFLTAIFGWFGLLSGCVGVLLLAWRIRTSGIAIWLIASVFTMIILLSNVFNDHFMMWVSRRFIPTVIPLIVIGIVVAARELYIRFASKSPILAIGLAAILIGIVALTTSPATYRIATTRDWPGLCAWFDDLAQSLPTGARVYCDQPGFAAPLRFMYGIRSFESYGDKSLSEYLLTFRQALNIETGNTYILTTRQQPELPGLTLQKTKHLTLRSHIQLQPKFSIPTGVKERGGEFTLYQVAYPDINSTTATPIRL